MGRRACLGKISALRDRARARAFPGAPWPLRTWGATYGSQQGPHAPGWQSPSEGDLCYPRDAGGGGRLRPHLENFLRSREPGGHRALAGVLAGALAGAQRGHCLLQLPAGTGPALPAPPCWLLGALLSHLQSALLPALSPVWLGTRGSCCHHRTLGTGRNHKNPAALSGQEDVHSATPGIE